MPTTRQRPDLEGSPMDTTAITIWLGIIAVATLVQATVVVIGGLIVIRRLARAEAVLDDLAREVRPIVGRVTAALDDLADLSARVRRADAQITATIDKVSSGVDHARTALVTRFWPAVGLARGLAALVRGVRSRRPVRRDGRQDALALARFVNEGGGGSHG